jgi:hypothetical protein
MSLIFTQLSDPVCIVAVTTGTASTSQDLFIQAVSGCALTAYALSVKCFGLQSVLEASTSRSNISEEGSRYRLSPRRCLLLMQQLLQLPLVVRSSLRFAAIRGVVTKPAPYSMYLLSMIYAPRQGLIVLSGGVQYPGKRSHLGVSLRLNSTFE